jgi:serine protease Do
MACLTLAVAGCPQRWDPENPPGVSRPQPSSGRETRRAQSPRELSQGSMAEPFDEVVAGALEDGDPVLEVDGTLYDAYALELAQGATLVVTMASMDLDPYVHVIDPNGQQVAHGGRPPDSQTREAEVIVVAPSAGEYHIYANAVSREMRGAYELHVVADPPPRPAPEPTSP